MRSHFALPVACMLLAFDASAAESWAVVGLRSDGGTMEEPVQAMRDALERALQEGATVLGEDEVRRRIGATPIAARSVEDWIDAAEIFYFQHDLPEAKSCLEEALALLAHRTDPRSWERSRAARLLLATVLLAQGGVEEEEGARAALRSVIAVSPEFRPEPRAYPVELFVLFDELRAEILTEPRRGSLRIDCKRGCAGARVWANTLGVGLADRAIPLPAGRYRILVGTEEIRSLVHDVEIAEGKETRLSLDLAWEASVEAGDGPSFEWSGEKESLDAAALLAASLGERDRMVVIREEVREGIAGSRAVVVDRSGLVRDRWSGSGWDDLARALVSGEETDAIAVAGLGGAQGGLASGDGSTEMAEVDRAELEGGPVDGAPAEPLPALRLEPPPANDRQELAVSPAALGISDDAETSAWIGPTRWASVGAAVVAASAGIWLRADATSRQERLLDGYRQSGGVVASVEEGRAASRRMSSLRTQADMGTALLVGAGAAAVTSIVLFLVD